MLRLVKTVRDIKLSKSKKVQTPRAGLFVPPYFIHFFKERGVCYEKIFKDFYFP